MLDHRIDAVGVKMFEPLEGLEQSVKIGFSAPQKSQLLDMDGFTPFSELSGEVMESLKLDLLFVLGASPLQTALVKHWSEEVGCISACIETQGRSVSCAESVIVNLKNKFEGDDFPNNVDVADIRYLAEGDSQLLAFNCHKELNDFLSSEHYSDIVSVFYLMHGEFSLERFEDEHKQLAEHVSDDATIFYSYLSQGIGECTALLAVRI